MRALDTVDLSFADPGLAQAIAIARGTTFEQRFRWLENTIDAFREQLLRNFKEYERVGCVHDGA